MLWCFILVTLRNKFQTFSAVKNEWMKKRCNVMIWKSIFETWGKADSGYSPTCVRSVLSLTLALMLFNTAHSLVRAGVDTRCTVLFLLLPLSISLAQSALWHISICALTNTNLLLTVTNLVLQVNRGKRQRLTIEKAGVFCSEFLLRCFHLSTALFLVPQDWDQRWFVFQSLRIHFGQQQVLFIYLARSCLDIMGQFRMRCNNLGRHHLTTSTTSTFFSIYTIH